MQIKTGVDIVNIPEFESNLELSKQTFLSKCFFDEEIVDKNPHSLAGIFAAKEAVIKALSLEPGSWLKIKVESNADGKPSIIIDETKFQVISHDLSISHSENYAIAQFSALVQ